MSATQKLSSDQFAALAQRVNRQQADGEDIGFSVYSSGPKVGQDVTNAYMVGGYGAPEGEVSLPAVGEAIKGYHDANVSTFSRPDATLGGWGPEGEGRVLLDSSESFPPTSAGYRAALKAAGNRTDSKGQPRPERAIGHISPEGEYTETRLRSGPPTGTTRRSGPLTGTTRRSGSSRPLD
jgi:hypothetical protein